MPEDFVKVAQTDDLAEGEMMRVVVGDEEIMVVHLDGNFYALDDICDHAYASLSEGDLMGEEVECYLHGARFNVKTGEVTAPPAEEDLTVYQVRVEGNDILVGPPKT